MKIIADLQLHSKYSRAVSQDMVLPKMSAAAKVKGIDLLATGDWMHPLWMSEVKAGLTEWSQGIYAAKENPDGAKFLLSAEISSIFSIAGKTYRVHTLVFSPSIDTCLKINEALRRRGANLSSDGRPIVGLSCQAIADIVFTIDNRCLVIPAHAWTPWFSVYGSKGGFDSLTDAFGPFTDQIYAIETGLSSDPAMNWRIKELENRAVVSFSDAHSPPKLGREATVFAPKTTNYDLRTTNYSYSDIYWAIAERFLGKNNGNLKISYTIEFYPEEGKYHWDGHRACGVVHSPQDTRDRGVTCPVCGRPLTVGVEYRVDELADKQLKDLQPVTKPNTKGLVGYFHPTDTTRPPYVKLVPLLEILAEVYESSVASKKIKEAYSGLTQALGSEFAALLDATESELHAAGGVRVAEAVMRVRRGDIVVDPGYDGVFGTVKIWGEKKQETTQQQMGLF